MSNDTRVHVSMPLDGFDLFVRLLNEAAEDLEGYISAEYPARDKYPSEMRRFQRDMAFVDEIRLAVKTYGERQ